MATKFAGFPTALIYDAPDGKAVKQLLWGDYVTLTGASANGWQPVRSRGVAGFMRDASLTPDRLLEIVFVDIGQGDGAMVVTPDDRHVLIDAGAEDNFYRFLRWRYGRFAQPFTFDAAVISHGDEDHYWGFNPVFTDPKISVRTLYHNGIVERAGADALGPRSGGYLTEIVTTKQQLQTLLGDPARRGRKQYPNLLHDFLTSGRLNDARGLSAADKFLPGYEANGGQMSIEVLGPVRENVGGNDRLRWFGDAGKTKNGHSILLRIVYKDISILLGGDLNIPAEHHLLRDATGYAMPPSEADRAAVLEGARKRFRSDVTKACHHGSADFTDLFLQSVDALVTVISSGDNEPYAHPRADALGAVGRWGRGNRPLTFSTELARSSVDAIKRPYAFKRELAAAQASLAAATSPTDQTRLQKKVDDLLLKIERSVAVYGAINLRTDGKRIVMAQKVEKPRTPSAAWDIYVIKPDANGVLRYESKYEN